MSMRFGMIFWVLWEVCVGVNMEEFWVCLVWDLGWGY